MFLTSRLMYVKSRELKRVADGSFFASGSRGVTGGGCAGGGARRAAWGAATGTAGAGARCGCFARLRRLGRRLLGTVLDYKRSLAPQSSNPAACYTRL